MDIASLIGTLIGCAALFFVGYEASHGNWSMFYSQEGLVTVGGGSVSVLFMAMPMERLKCVPGYIKSFMFSKGKKPAEIIKLISTLSEKTRRDGILALESDYESIKAADTFLGTGIRMAIDGMEPAVVEQTLRMEVLAMQDRHKSGKKFFDLIKLYGPGYGLVGTLVGQIGMFGHLGGDVQTIGHMLAVAVVATMYGTILANAVAGPIGDKLGIRSGEEILNREMILQGVLSIQAGDNPRITVDKMLAFLPGPKRDSIRNAA